MNSAMPIDTRHDVVVDVAFRLAINVVVLTTLKLAAGSRRKEVGRIVTRDQRRDALVDVPRAAGLSRRISHAAMASG